MSHNLLCALSNLNFKLTRLYSPLTRSNIPVFESVLIQLDTNKTRLFRFKRYTTDPLQTLDGPRYTRLLLSDVDLHHSGTALFSRVADHEFDLVLLSGSSDGQVGVAEFGIRQPMTKWEESFLLV